MQGEPVFPGCSKLKLITICLFFSVNSGCMFSYLIKSSYHQQKILRSRTPISEVLTDKKISLEIKKKLELVEEARIFSYQVLNLKKTDNYSTYVQLDRPYVTWIVTVSEPYEIKSKDWWFPIVGHVPYKGFFSKKEADDEARQFINKGYDTYVRGVTAYSTLGWFEDPILSTMINYKDNELVELIIHESVHATLFIKSQADFNERLATFLGQEGSKLFYEKKGELYKSELQSITDSSYDTKIFSEFISQEINDLKKWYSQLPPDRKNPNHKNKRLKEVQKKFESHILPLLKTNDYSGFKDRGLNNAILIGLETYVQDLSDFQKLSDFVKKDFLRF